MATYLTLITPTQGNAVALKRTIDSLKGVVNEVVVGSVCVFPEDEEKIISYGKDISLKVIKHPFNYIFKNGFSAILNNLASQASNDWVLYLNVGEVVHQGKDEILSSLTNGYNCYYLTHPTEQHHWYRVYNRNEMKWGGIIHEEIGGLPRPCGTPLFMFDDTEKDKDDPFKEKVYNDIKELCYWNQYLKLVDQPHLIANTNPGWIKFATDGFHSFVERMHQKGNRYEAFITGDLQMYLDDIENNTEFK